MSKKDLQKLIIPLMFEQLLAVSVGMVDTLMVSQAGEAAISGVALVDNINRLRAINAPLYTTGFSRGRNPTVENVFKIARALGIKPSNLFEEL